MYGDVSMAICIRYFSKKESKVLNDFLCFIELERATADNLLFQVKEFLDNANLPLQNMLAIGTDGESNLCGVNHSLYTLLMEEIPQLMLLKCTCHSIHLCVSKAATVLPSNLHFLNREVYSWVKCPLRKLEYQKVQFD